MSGFLSDQGSLGVCRGQSLTSQTAFGGQLPYKGSLGRPAVIFDHSLFSMMVSFYEPRTTSHGFFSDSDAAFRRDKLKLTTSLRVTLSS